MNDIQDKIKQGLICPYCNSPSKHMDSSRVYGRSYGMIYACLPCNAWVGCHTKNQKKALGRLANTELREAKRKAHTYFDAVWKNGIKTRPLAYKWLAAQLSISEEDTHIGMFDITQCQKVVEVSKKLLKEKGYL